MCDIVQLFVSDDEALLQVAEELAPALAPRHIVIAHSTVSPESMQRAARIVEGRGARFIEAPFTGSKTAAEKGELVYYVAGDDAALGEARPVLEASGKEVMVIGEIGQATVIKIATNMVTAASVQAAAEALALVRAVGLPMEKFVEAMRGNASHSTTLASKLPKIIEADFEPHFSMKHMLKDVQIASRLGLAHQLELGVTAAARDRLLEQMQRGYGEDDYCAIARKYFADVTSAAGAETGLELFEQPPAAEPVQPDSFVPMMPDIVAQEPESAGVATAEVSETAQSPVVSEETMPGSSPEQPALASAPEEPKEAPIPDESTTVPVSEQSVPTPTQEESTTTSASEPSPPPTISEGSAEAAVSEEAAPASLPEESMPPAVPEEPQPASFPEQASAGSVLEESARQESPASPEGTTPAEPHEVGEEEQTSRSLLSRFLRRGTS